MLSKIFKVLIVFGAFLFIFRHCGYNRGCHRNSIFNVSSIRGEGTITKQTRDVGVFTKLNLQSSVDVEITQGATSSLIIETYPNIAELIETVVEDGTLKIREKKNSGIFSDFNSNERIKIYIVNPSFNEIKVSGSGNLEAKNKLTATDLKISVTGSGDAKFEDLSATKVNVNVTGSGNVEMEGGTTDELIIDVLGSGDADLIKCVSKSVTAQVSGSGNLKCNATEKYDLNVRGSGDIRYKKSNATVNSKTSGSGSIEVE